MASGSAFQMQTAPPGTLAHTDTPGQEAEFSSCQPNVLFFVSFAGLHKAATTKQTNTGSSRETLTTGISAQQCFYRK